jgi:hypothetical protein
MAYTSPTAVDLRARYPAFAAVDDATIAYWLTDGLRFVDQGWTEGDYAPAIMAVSAHNMVLAGVAGITGGDQSAMLANGVTDFQSGSVRLRFSDEAVKAAVAGGYGSTRYGLEYFALLRTNKGGPRTQGPGAVCFNNGFNGYAGPLPGWQ